MQQTLKILVSNLLCTVIMQNNHNHVLNTKSLQYLGIKLLFVSLHQISEKWRRIFAISSGANVGGLPVFCLRGLAQEKEMNELKQDVTF